jgi:hypothetical protein
MVSTKNLLWPLCKGSQFPYHCGEFLNLPINNRISFVKKMEPLPKLSKTQLLHK